MAYGRKYYKEFDGYNAATRQSYTVLVDIYEDGFAGNAIEIEEVSASPLQLSLDSSGDPLYTSIKKTSATFNIINTGQFDYSEFYTSNAKKYKMMITSTVFNWTGYLVPQAVSFDLATNGEFSLTASDGLHLLQSIDYVAAENDMTTLADFLTDIETKIGLSTFNRTSTINTEYGNIWNSLIYEGMFTNKTYEEAFEMVLKAIGMQVRYWKITPIISIESALQTASVKCVNDYPELNFLAPIKTAKLTKNITTLPSAFKNALVDDASDLKPRAANSYNTLTNWTVVSDNGLVVFDIGANETDRKANKYKYINMFVKPTNAPYDSQRLTGNEGSYFQLRPVQKTPFTLSFNANFGRISEYGRSSADGYRAYTHPVKWSSIKWGLYDSVSNKSYSKTTNSWSITGTPTSATANELKVTDPADLFVDVYIPIPAPTGLTANLRFYLFTGAVEYVNAAPVGESRTNRLSIKSIDIDGEYVVSENELYTAVNGAVAVGDNIDVLNYEVDFGSVPVPPLNTSLYYGSAFFDNNLNQLEDIIIGANTVSHEQYLFNTILYTQNEIRKKVYTANVNMLTNVSPFWLKTTLKSDVVMVNACNFDFKTSQLNGEFTEIMPYVYREWTITSESEIGSSDWGGSGGGGGSGTTAPVPEHDLLAGITSIDGAYPETARGIHLTAAASDQLKALLANILTVLTTADTTTPAADNNVFSALRTLVEISNRAISKTEADTAAELITFNKGIEVGTFTSGHLGTGGAIHVDENGNSVAEFDKLKVRKRAEFFEVLIQTSKHVGGELIVSPANMICNKVEELAGVYRCYFDRGENNEANNEFKAGDQARCSVFTGSGQKYYWRLVTAIGADYIDVSKTVCDTYSDAPSIGDYIFQLGSQTDTERQSAQVISSFGPDAPSYIQYSGINSFSLVGKSVTKFTSKGNEVFGRLHIEEGSTGWTNIAGLPEEFLAANEYAQGLIDGIAIGSVNLLRNTAFTGDYVSKDLSASDPLAAEDKLYSEPLKYWTSYGANTVFVEPDSTSGFGVNINGTLGQTTPKLVAGESYMMSFKAKGSGSLVVSLGTYTISVSILSTYSEFVLKFVPTETKAYDFYFTGIASIYEPQLERGTIASKWSYSPVDAHKSEERFQAIKYITDAIINGSVDIIGGLVLCNMLQLGNYKDGVLEKVTSGLSGIYNDDDDPAFWSGGTLEDAIRAIMNPDDADGANAVITHGGRAIFNDAIIRGIIYATGGMFRGRIESNKDGSRIILDPETRAIKMIDTLNREVASYGFYQEEGTNKSGPRIVLKAYNDDTTTVYSSSVMFGGSLTIYDGDVNVANFVVDFGSKAIQLNPDKIPNAGTYVGDLYKDGNTLKIKI